MNQDTEALKSQLKIGKNGRKKTWIWVSLVLLSAFAAYWVFATLLSQKEADSIYQTTKVTRGDIRATVSATGTLQPTNEVEVGSELSGKIDDVMVDYNDKVVKGQLLAKLNTETLQAQVLQSKAALQVSEAGVLEAEASLQEAIAEYKRLVQVQKLSGGKLPSEADMISATAAKKRAEAAKTTALAQVEQAKASLGQDQTDLQKADIISPINGIVLTRSIEPGQTVAAAMSAPVLFTLAEDLTSMELQVNVDEADVGQVAEGQTATFTVDSYPNLQFPATIKQVRFGAETTDGVVTYTTLLEVSNTDLKLRPGMTATADILVKEKLDVLMVPLSALRFTPDLIVAEEEEDLSIIESLTPRPPHSDTDIIKQQTDENGYKFIWRLVDNQPKSIRVKTGESSGSLTEIVEGDLSEGDEIIIGAEVALP